MIYYGRIILQNLPQISSKLVKIELSKSFVVKILPIFHNNFTTTSFHLFSDVNNAAQTSPKQNKAKVTVNFVKPSGERITANGKEGDNLLDVVINNNIDIDGFGACEGTLACSTCHLIFSKQDYDRLPEKPTDEELDMLDLAYELSDTSRLGCQVYLTKNLDGLEVKIPAGVNDVRSN